MERKTGIEITGEEQKSLVSIENLCRELGSNPSCLPVIEEILGNTKHETLYDYFASINPEFLASEVPCNVSDKTIPHLLDSISTQCFDFLNELNPDLYKMVQRTQNSYNYSIGDSSEDLDDYAMRDSFFEIRYCFFWLAETYGMETALEFLRDIVREAILILCHRMGAEIPQKILDLIPDEKIEVIQSTVVAETIQRIKDQVEQMRNIELNFPDLPNKYNDSDFYSSEDKAWFKQLLDTYPSNFEEIVAELILDVKEKQPE